jgi:hypothetical protein
VPVHDVASDDDQVMVALCPPTNELGLIVTNAMGTGGGAVEI